MDPYKAPHGWSAPASGPITYASSVPQYTPAPLIPLSSPTSKHKRTYFVPPSMISCVRGWSGVVVPSNKSQRKKILYCVPGVDPTKGPYQEDQRIIRYISSFLPHFIYLSPISESKDGVTKFPPNLITFLAVNPNRIVNVYPESDSNGERTVVDIEHDVAGRGDNAAGETVYQVIVGRRVDEVVRAVAGEQSYAFLRNELRGADIGFGLTLR
ncbi:hypothetical protein M427DRAFT_159898 [Gonapodya prolifera JEL478]|uniref:Uncharacterized protein n=1 Tax=Gonapodya prolifera (strain JEL478) TaxID=1344416 RepID=A0A138ZZV8_GONPJ|nr:hypothetical protein M427DRAFT_159898 [Gonapodya prolifera JEL478]|eukprot:KXS10041.1 hypothetical protein M427DRAFT_159898 [Gonapodya prolifera JEL478]